jgi:hypothetical protein
MRWLANIPTGKYAFVVLVMNTPYAYEGACACVRPPEHIYYRSLEADILTLRRLVIPFDERSEIEGFFLLLQMQQQISNWYWNGGILLLLHLEEELLGMKHAIRFTLFYIIYFIKNRRSWYYVVPVVLVSQLAL